MHSQSRTCLRNNKEGLRMQSPCRRRNRRTAAAQKKESRTRSHADHRLRAAQASVQHQCTSLPRPFPCAGAAHTACARRPCQRTQAAGVRLPPCPAPTMPRTFWSQVRRQLNRPSMFSRRCGSLPALGMTATPRCTFHLSSTCGAGGAAGWHVTGCQKGSGMRTGRWGACQTPCTAPWASRRQPPPAPGSCPPLPPPLPPQGCPAPRCPGRCGPGGSRPRCARPAGTRWAWRVVDRTWQGDCARQVVHRLRTRSPLPAHAPQCGGCPAASHPPMLALRRHTPTSLRWASRGCSSTWLTTGLCRA